MNSQIRSIRKRLREVDDVAPFLAYVSKLEYQLARARKAKRELEYRLKDIEAIDGALNDKHDSSAGKPITAPYQNDSSRSSSGGGGRV